MAEFKGDEGNNVEPGLFGAVVAAGDDEIYGLGGDDTLIGYAGDDVIEGGADADNIIGGMLDVVDDIGLVSPSGNDTAIYDTSTAGVSINLSVTSMIVVEVLGVKIALTNASIGSGGHAEGDILTGITNLRGSNFKDTLIGNADANVLSGLDDDDTLTGAAGNDTLMGGGGSDTLNGGTGDDWMTGGLGSDTYIVNSLSDAVDEMADGGSADRIASSVDWVLAAGQEIELLTTTNSAGTSSIDLRGNPFAQKIVGNNGRNDLHDGGGSQADRLEGRAGDDTYYVYNADAVVVEQDGEGNDKVYTGVDYQLGSNTHVETLATTSYTANHAIDLTGNKFAQTIIGNWGDNILHDGGTGEADTLYGQRGNDTYLVYNSGDVIGESAGDENDVVAAAVTFVLTAGNHIEGLRTTNLNGLYTIDLTGNDLSQEITGNAGTNRLDGKGGEDRLYGGGGADTFVFSSALGAGNVDGIDDFKVASDKIELSSAIFTALGAGTLAAEAFQVNTTGLAQDADDRIIYDTDTGELYYDADGSAAGGGILFAQFGIGLGLTNADFAVV